MRRSAAPAAAGPRGTGGHEPDLPALGQVDRFERRRLEATLAMSALAHDPERWEAVLRRLL
jgi:hypothetical protein